MEILDKSEMATETSKKKQFKKEVKEFEADMKKSKGLNLLSDSQMMHCERVVKGMTSNCALCEASNKEMFGRCKNKWCD